jgi:hypothetical protein
MGGQAISIAEAKNETPEVLNAYAKHAEYVLSRNYDMQNM